MERLHPQYNDRRVSGSLYDLSAILPPNRRFLPTIGTHGVGAQRWFEIEVVRGRATVALDVYHLFVLPGLKVPAAVEHFFFEVVDAFRVFADRFVGRVAFGFDRVGVLVAGAGAAFEPRGDAESGVGREIRGLVVDSVLAQRTYWPAVRVAVGVEHFRGSVVALG